MLPDIIFRRAGTLYEGLLKREDFQMPDEKIFTEKIDQLKLQWQKWGSILLGEMSVVTGLIWQEKDIVCYISANTPSSFSHPLTLKLYEDIETMFDVLTHELIHRLLNNPENGEILRANREIIVKPYLNEPKNVQHHIIIHAIHAHLLNKFFDSNRLDKVINFATKPEYIRSWEIVKEQGFNRIVEQLT